MVSANTNSLAFTLWAKVLAKLGREFCQSYLSKTFLVKTKEVIFNCCNLSLFGLSAETFVLFSLSKMRYLELQNK